jgi:hypothetical protein
MLFNFAHRRGMGGAHWRFADCPARDSITMLTESSELVPPLPQGDSGGIVDFTNRHLSTVPFSLYKSLHSRRAGRHIIVPGKPLYQPRRATPRNSISCPAWVFFWNKKESHSRGKNTRSFS